jgi:hypothetical protein
MDDVFTAGWMTTLPGGWGYRGLEPYAPSLIEPSRLLPDPALWARHAEEPDMLPPWRR